jgi:Archaeal/vacuolar-type H+-ATPase subunit B
MKEYKTITEISGPLVFAEVDEPIGYDEMVEIETPDGETRSGQVLDSSSDHVAIQTFEERVASTASRRSGFSARR